MLVPTCAGHATEPTEAGPAVRGRPIGHPSRLSGAVTYPVALATTLVVEVPVWALLLHAVVRAPWRRALVVGVAVNLVSHPLFWFVLTPALGALASEWLAFAAAEAFVVLTEAVMSWWWVRRSPGPTPPGGAGFDLFVGISLAANLLSVAAGFVLQMT